MHTLLQAATECDTPTSWADAFLIIALFLGFTGSIGFLYWLASRSPR